MKITITGDQGAGKSTVAKEVAKELGLPYFYVGGFMREIAEKRGITLLELGQVAETDGGKVDHELDSMVASIGKTKHKFVLDARLGFHFIPDTIKVYLKVSLDEAARRIFAAKRGGENENTTLAKTKANILRRKKSEHDRYFTYYGIDYPRDEDFDIIIDTTGKTPEKVVKELLGKLNIYKKITKV